MVVGRQAFPIGKVTFQGRTVKLWEGIYLYGMQKKLRSYAAYVL